ncbi:PREDICTED: zinc finger protein 638-like [Cariama cristata]|uniref:zinc finger protein 638-like n=1 Tax=Cariama cristata TaxID=54380 RepID=UPI00052088CC|nr:PREDICTED: zinc finger protein 638-like [Cariama cristata]
MSAVQIEPSESHLEGAVRESAASLAGTSAEKVDAGVEVAVASIKSADTESSEAKSEEMLLLPPPSSVEKEGNAEPELSESAVGSGSEKEVKEKDEEFSAPALEPPEELSDVGEAEDGPSHCAVKLAAGETAGAIPEVVPPDSDAASVEMVSSVVTQTNKLDAPEKNPVSDTVKTEHEMPVTPITEKKPVLKTESAMEKRLDTAGADREMKPEESVLQVGIAAEENPEKLLVKTGAETEKKLEKFVAKVGAAVENAANAVSENNEGSLIKAHQNKGTGPAKTDETCKAVTLNSSLPVKESSSVGKTILKAVVSLPDISKSRVPVQRDEPSPCKGGEQTAPSKPETRGQAAAEKKIASKEVGHPRPGSSRSSLGDGSGKCTVNRSSVVDGKGGNGRNSSQQEKDSRVESRASSKQSQEGESRSSSVKTDNSSNKASVGGNTKASKSGASSSAKQKEIAWALGRKSRKKVIKIHIDELVEVELQNQIKDLPDTDQYLMEEELFPFNLDEFVTVDEVVEEIESPVKTRRNPLRGKRKDGAKTSSSSEPSSKRRKGKSSMTRIAESDLSFVTLDEIGEEEEDVTAHDPQGLVVVDEVMEEEELMSEAVKDPQSLVTLDEISEQEDLSSHKDVPRSVFEEQDLKAEPLVTVDEIGEVEELPLNEPTDLNIEDVLKHKEEEKVAAEDTGDCASSQVPDDPSALVTVDEIQEDNEDNPLVTLDEVNEDEDDFLADFNRLKEELNFVTVDEVGEEDEEEGPEEEEEITAIAGPEEEDIVAVAGPEEMEILGDMSPEEEIIAISKSKDQLGSADKEPESKWKKVASSDVSKTQGTPKDLDYLVPKAGFFCQICSLFYADETSVKNHCKTLLHQQNMEKFMAKQKDEDNDGEEPSSR